MNKNNSLEHIKNLSGRSINIIDVMSLFNKKKDDNN